MGSNPTYTMQSTIDPQILFSVFCMKITASMPMLIMGVFFSMEALHFMEDLCLPQEYE